MKLTLLIIILLTFSNITFITSTDSITDSTTNKDTNTEPDTTTKPNPIPIDNEFNQIFSIPHDHKLETLSVTADFDKTIIIKIRGNKTTGYSWYVFNTEQIESEHMLYPTNLSATFDTNDYYQFDSAKKGAKGVGGFFYFKFKPLRLGVSNIVFINKRRWEDKYIGKVEVTIKVERKEKDVRDL